jgi:UDP-2,3-diacylglucosamine hydrolase
VAAVAGRWRPAGAKGVLFKAPKPGQDLRVDMPALGPETVRRAAAAGLAGIAWQAGGALVLDRAATVAAADDAGLFLWARPA